MPLQLNFVRFLQLFLFFQQNVNSVVFGRKNPVVAKKNAVRLNLFVNNEFKFSGDSGRYPENAPLEQQIYLVLEENGFLQINVFERFAF